LQEIYTLLESSDEDDFLASATASATATVIAPRVDIPFIKYYKPENAEDDDAHTYCNHRFNVRTIKWLRAQIITFGYNDINRSSKNS
jgi:hypothetical protein